MNAEREENQSIVDIYTRRGTSNFNVRIPNALADNIDVLVDEGEFKSRSEFVVTAIRQYLEHIRSQRATNQLVFSIDSDERSPKIRGKR